MIAPQRKTGLAWWLEQLSIIFGLVAFGLIAFGFQTAIRATDHWPYGVRFIFWSAVFLTPTFTMIARARRDRT